MFGRRGQWHLAVVADEFLDGLAGVGRLTGDQVVERAAERVDVGAGVDFGRVTRLLGCHVRGCAEHGFAEAQAEAGGSIALAGHGGLAAQRA